MKRAFDVVVATCLIIATAPLMLAIALLVKLTSPGPALYWSDRVGQNNRIFSMPKFRTMRIGTPELPTHLLTDSRRWITPVGRVLRKTSLDELPQLWSILVGDMSWVGPRPVLFNQTELLELRTQFGAHRVPVGLTGWAQINGRDDLEDRPKAQLDAWYAENRSFLLDLKIMCLTAVKVLRQEGIVQVDERQTIPLPVEEQTIPMPHLEPAANTRRAA